MDATSESLDAFVTRMANRVYDAATALDRAPLPPDTERAVHVASTRVMRAVSYVLLDPEESLSLLQFAVVRTIRDLEEHRAHPIVQEVTETLVRVHDELKHGAPAEGDPPGA